MKFNKNLTTGSQDIVQTKKSHANAYANKVSRQCQHQKWIFNFSTAVTLKIKSRSPKIWPVLCYISIIYPWKFGKNPTTASQVLCKQESLKPMPTPTPTKSYANTNANIENEFSIFLLICLEN